MKKFITLLFFIVFTASTVFSQVTVSGTILDSNGQIQGPGVPIDIFGVCLFMVDPPLCSGRNLTVYTDFAGGYASPMLWADGIAVVSITNPPCKPESILYSPFHENKIWSPVLYCD